MKLFTTVYHTHYEIDIIVITEALQGIVTRNRLKTIHLTVLSKS